MLSGRTGDLKRDDGGPKRTDLADRASKEHRRQLLPAPQTVQTSATSSVYRRRRSARTAALEGAEIHAAAVSRGVGRRSGSVSESLGLAKEPCPRTRSLSREHLANMLGACPRPE